MGGRIIFVNLFIAFLFCRAGLNAESKTKVYSALKSGDPAAMDVCLKNLAGDTTQLSAAYKGTLMMRRANFEKGVAGKLELFKKGKVILEDVIRQDSLNAEYRFLRLMIQENCPGFLKYHSNISDDATRVKQFYKNFSPDLKSVISDYAKTSAALKGIGE